VSAVEIRKAAALQSAVLVVSVVGFTTSVIVFLSPGILQ
jgi:hypothetical protein